MRKLLTVIFSLFLIFTMALFCYAQEATDTEEIAQDEAVMDDFSLEEYIKDRIVPVVVGVLTSVVAVITTLAQVLKVIKSLKDSKDLLEDSKEQIKTVSKSTEGQIAEIKDSIKELLPLFEEIGCLKEAIEKYKDEMGTLEHILTLAYSADEKLVRSGKAKEMALLLAKVGEGVTNGEEKT